VSGSDNNDKPMSYKVTLVGVDQSAAPDYSFDGASSGHHLASAEFRITGVSGTGQDDADSDAGVNGTNQQVYQPSFDGLAAGTNFSSADFSVSAGQTQVGYIAFELPDSAKVASVTWQPNAFGSNAPATWTVSP
jgi:hypothetical protein